MRASVRKLPAGVNRLSPHPLARRPHWNLLPLPEDSAFAYYGSMKTTIDIPDKELEEVIRHTRARTKRDAIVTAISDFNRRKRLEKLADQLVCRLSNS